MFARQGPMLRVCFRDYEFDRETRELYRHGLKIKIRGHPVDILAYLLERPGEAVGREELMDRLWHQNPLTDCEHLLNNGINKLRAALCDHVENPRFIETIPGLGYRFVCSTAIKPLKSEHALRVNRSADADTLAKRPPPRLSVLPFTNPGGEVPVHCVEGLAAQIVVELGRARKHLVVVPPTAAPRAPGAGQTGFKTTGPPTEYDLSGTFWSVQAKRRLVVQLIQVNDQSCTWSKSYTCSGTDGLAAQDRIARDIARKISQILMGIKT